jgi:hypothetical protein
MTIPAWVAQVRKAFRRESRPPSDTPGGAVVHQVDQSHDEVADYWTDERLRDARPREIIRDSPQASTDPPEASRP